jgi:hypothetical protein
MIYLPTFTDSCVSYSNKGKAKHITRFTRLLPCITLHKIMTCREVAYSAFTKIKTLISTITEQSLTKPHSVPQWARDFLQYYLPGQSTLSAKRCLKSCLTAQYFWALLLGGIRVENTIKVASLNTTT